MFIFYYIISNGFFDKKDIFTITLADKQYSGKIN